MSDSRLFVVRVWRQWTSFRASVRRVDDEEAQLFSTAAEVARYLEQSAPAEPPAADDLQQEAK